MPFKKDPKGADRENAQYCSYCFENGRLNYEGSDVNEFKKAMVDAIVSRGESKLKAKFLPIWLVLLHAGRSSIKIPD